MEPAARQTNGVQSGGSVSTLSVGLGTDVLAGTLLVAVGTTSNKDMPSGAVTDDRDNDWVRWGQALEAVNGTRVAMWACVSRDAGPFTATLAPSAADFQSLVILEQEGAWDPNNLLNVGYTVVQEAAAGATSPSTGPLPTTGPTLIVGAVSHSGLAATTITPTGTGFTQVFEAESVASMPVNVVYQIGTGGPYTASWTLSPGQPWCCGAVAFQETVVPTGARAP